MTNVLSSRAARAQVIGRPVVWRAQTLIRKQFAFLSIAVVAMTIMALVATSSSVSAQTPPAATPTATAAAPAAPAKTAAPAPGKTGNAGLATSASSSLVLVLGFALVAGTAVVLGRRATSSR
jgi:hypothetical protein